MPRATYKHLKFIAELESSRLNDLASGAGLTIKTGYSISDLIGKATIERFRYAASLQRQASEIWRSAKAPNRLAVSRAYYSMYHCLRAVVFFVNGGDEFEKHSELPKHLPKDFPNVASWETDLKSARLERNRADYEPFPKGDAAYAPSAELLIAKSKYLLRVARTYLRGKGLPV